MKLLVASAVHAVITFKRSTTALNGALVMLAKDLSTPVPRPPVRELSDIADGIAILARSLAQAREGEERLGRELERQERLAALGRVVAGVAHDDDDLIDGWRVGRAADAPVARRAPAR